MEEKALVSRSCLLPLGLTGVPVHEAREGIEMKNPNRERVSRLEGLPNVGKVIAGHLRSIGIDHPRTLIGRDPFELYEALCATSGKTVDPCVLDVLCR